MEPRHEPVMLAEVLEALAVRPGALVVDGTLGLGGHALAILERAGPEGRLVGIDWDPDMLALARERLPKSAELHHADYRAIPEILGERKGDAILLDMGLSSVHLDDPSRGIAFSHEGPLDFRMDRTRGEPASAWLNRAGAPEIERALLEHGGERWARRIAQVIVDRRRERPLRTTGDLVDCVLAAVPAAKRDPHIHPATRTFQAVRIVVNRELEGLEEALEAIARCLAPGGTLCVLAYHSGEDRAAKRVFHALDGQGFDELTRRPLRPSEAEVARNRRSRSARLRALRRDERRP